MTDTQEAGERLSREARKWAEILRALARNDRQAEGPVEDHDAWGAAAYIELLADTALSRRSADTGQAGVVVKPLEWVKHPTAAMWRCDTIVGLYQVAAIVEPASWTFDGLPGQSAEGSASGSGEAMAAAFEHYRSAILAALKDQPHD